MVSDRRRAPPLQEPVQYHGGCHDRVPQDVLSVGDNMAHVEFRILIDRDLKRELKDAAAYAEEPLSIFCGRLLRDGLKDLRRLEMEY